MATVSRHLPRRPDLDVPEGEARELLAHWREGRPEALERLRHAHPDFNDANPAALPLPAIALTEAQRVIAREYGLSSWAALTERIRAATVAGELQEAIEAGQRDAVVAILRTNPEMLHLPVWSANWGPPLSHAANLGRLEIMQAVVELGARDVQHAFDRAVLQGQIDCARWLHAHGARLVPGIVMGACETLNLEGFRFLLELGAPLVNAHGDRLAPLALVLETYARHPPAKHAILALLALQGYELPDTPMMAFHRGDLARLRAYLRADPRLLERRFTLREIYPPECGCAQEGRSGMHWTPIDGTTLLHLAVDFQEREIFDWLLTAGADVNVKASVAPAGFGGHTPLFNAVVCGPGSDATFAAALLARGASRDARASLRKFLDWCEQPRWHEGRDVTPAEWARAFPERGWVNQAVVTLLDT